MDLRILRNQLPGHQRDVVGAGHMPLCIQTAAIDEMGVIHAQTLGALIHHFHKEAFRPGHILGHGHGRVIGRGHGDALDHRIHALSFPGLQKHLGTAHGRGVLRGSHCIVQMDFPLGNGVKNK